MHLDDPTGWRVCPEVRDWEGLPSLQGPQRCDLCVVGLGASGLAAVDWAVSEGLDVIGLDRARVGGGAAGRNAGFLLTGPPSFFHRAAARWGAERAAEIHRLTEAELDRLSAELGERVTRTGSLRIADDALERADVEAQFAAMQAAGVAVARYRGPLGAGLFVPGDAAINPAERCLLAARRLRSRARLFEHSPVTGITGGATPVVTTETGSVSAGAVVVCVDGRLDALVPALGARVRTVRLQMLATAPVPPLLPCPLYARWGYDYARQTNDGRLFVGGGRDRFPTENDPADDEPTDDVQDYIEQWATRLAGTPLMVEHRWAGLVAFSVDGAPVCELVDDGVAAAGAYDGTGNLLGPVVSRAAAQMAVERSGPPDLPWYR